MTVRQWLLITMVVILNIVILGALFGPPSLGQHQAPTPTWTPYPTFTPKPWPTATAILMPTMSPAPTSALAVGVPTPIVHIVAQNETLDKIAEAYGVSLYALRMVNHIEEGAAVQAGQELIIPPVER
jgi:hypothetical protein